MLKCVSYFTYGLCHIMKEDFKRIEYTFVTSVTVCYVTYPNTLNEYHTYSFIHTHKQLNHIEVVLYQMQICCMNNHCFLLLVSGDVPPKLD